MAESRVEKYKDYRKSMLTDGNPTTKVAIDTSLKATTLESDSSITSKEISLLKKLVITKRINIGLFFFLMFTIITLSIVFGIILF